MISFAPRRAGLFALLGALLFGAPAPVAAQYFGRNKVQYEKFDFRITRSSHFDLYFYPAESLVVHDAGRLAERWYTRHSDSFRHTFDRKSVVFYADHPDFQQTNVVGEAISEETGGITEGLRTRVVMPFTGIYADNDHVLGHELVHVFQYSVAENGPGGLARLNALPLWLIEGMAEYFSLGRDDPLTAMWLRDAAERDNLPTIKQLTNDPRFFPYRYGQALGVRRRTLGRSGGRRRLPHLAPDRLRGGDPARPRHQHRFALQGLDQRDTARLSAGARGTHASQRCGRGDPPDRPQDRRHESGSDREPGR